MASIPQNEIERLKSDVSLQRLVEASGVKLERKGQDLIGCCPFHDDKTPSLVVTPSKNLWHCLGACNTGGDPIAWVMKREGVSFRHAVELLRSDYSPAPAGGAVSVVAKSTVAKLAPIALPNEDAAVLAEVVGYYQSTLKQNPEAMAYLEKRGLMHPDLIDTFRLGFSDRTLGYRIPQANRKAGAEMRGRLQALGVMRESGHEHMRGSLVIPLYDLHGRVVNLYGRKVTGNLRAGTPDHLYLPGPNKGLFNPTAIQSSEEIILCEALIDALTFWCAGYRNVTSAFGATGVTDDLIQAFRASGTKRALIAFDRDDAGDKGAAAVAERLAGLGIGAYRVNFPQGLDANAYALEERPASESLGQVLRAAEWMKGGGGRRRIEIAPGPEALTPEVSLAAETEPLAVQSERPPEPLPAPTYAGPMPPPAPPAIDAEIGERDIAIKLGDRLWRVRGLHRNTSPESLKINLMVRRGDHFHVDTLDLLSAKSRNAYVAESSAELCLPADAIKRDLGQILLKLEAIQDEALAILRAPAAPADAMTAAEESEAMAWLQSPNLLDRIAADVAACGVVGEAENAQAVYLAALSRKLDRPLAILIQSTSAAGKSALMDAILDLLPDEEKVAYSAMTGQSLFYLGEADLKHKALAIAEEEGARQAAYALKLLQSQGNLTIASTGKDPATGKLITQKYSVGGPVALMMTTTAIDLDEELRNRCLVLSIDESRAQTQAIHARQRFEETLAGLAANEDRAKTLRLHHCAQRLLKPIKVVNPYAEQLTFLDDQTRTRRDHRKYLTLIRVITLLHQHQRPIRQLVRQGHEPVAYVEATLDDIAAANRLAHAVLGGTLDELPPQTRRLLSLVKDMVDDKAKAEGLKPREVRFTRREVREAVGWGDTQLKVHLGRLEALEYLLVRRDSGRFLYELHWSGEGADGASFLMGLINVEALVAEQAANEWRYDDNRAGMNEDQAGNGRPEVAPLSAPGRPPESTPSEGDSNDA